MVAGKKIQSQKSFWCVVFRCIEKKGNISGVLVPAGFQPNPKLRSVWMPFRSRTPQESPCGSRSLASSAQEVGHPGHPNGNHVCISQQPFFVYVAINTVNSISYANQATAGVVCLYFFLFSECLYGLVTAGNTGVKHAFDASLALICAQSIKIHHFFEERGPVGS